MKILIINSVCGIGSTGRICTDLYEELVNQGHECCIAYGRGLASSEYNTYKISNKLDNYWHVFETRFLDNHGFASRKVTKKFIQYIQEYNPDVIHLHNIHGYYLNIKILFRYLEKFSGKIVWTFHDQWPFSSSEAYIFDNPEDKTRFLEYPKTYFPFRDKLSLKKKVFTLLSKERTVIVTPSKWLLHSINNSFLPYKVSLINNGIDLTKFSPSPNKELIDKYGLQQKKIILGCSNIWDKRKGLNYFIELSQKVSSEYQIVIIGKTNMELPKNIIHIERTDSIEELAEWYSISYVFFNPTQMENFPTVNIESLACGTPIVTFGKGGSGEVVNKSTGVIIQNIDELLQLLEKNNFLEYRNDCIINSSYYSQNKMLDSYIDLYTRDWTYI